MKTGWKTFGLVVLLSLVVCVGSCKKDDEEDEIDPVVEHAEIEQYALDNDLNGQFTQSGLYYVIGEEGNDDHPTDTSRVTVNYKGYYLSGGIFEKSEYHTFDLSELIEGWKEGLPMIGEGGDITLLIPSHLAYNNGIRAFDIHLYYTTK